MLTHSTSPSSVPAVIKLIQTRIRRPGLVYLPSTALYTSICLGTLGLCTHLHEFSFHTPPSLPLFTIYGWAVTASGRVYEKEWTIVTNRTEVIIRSYADGMLMPGYARLEMEDSVLVQDVFYSVLRLARCIP